jgi:predicted enzyme related to lactoylglutathione lyase
MARVTGIGGVFFKAKDPTALAAWYQEHLGVPFDSKMGCAIIQWSEDPRPDGGQTVWCLAKDDSDWFQPSQSTFMINYRVDDMAGMLEKLKAGGILPVKGPDTDFNGIFTWILDPEGNKVELWQPIEG